MILRRTDREGPNMTQKTAVKRIEFKKNATDLIRIERKYFMGLDVVDVRTYYPPRGEGDDYRPSAKGICFQVHLLPKLIAGLQQIDEQISGTD